MPSKLEVSVITSLAAGVIATALTATGNNVLIGDSPPNWKSKVGSDPPAILSP